MPFKGLEWKPNPKQAEFLALPMSIKEGFYGGGAGSGKSEVLLAYPLVHRWHENPQFKMVFMRRTFPEIRNEIIPRSREFYLKFGAKLNKSEMSWTFPREDQYGSGAEPNGATIFMGHCENEDDVHKYDSMEINLYAPDELTSFTRWIYTYIAFSRVRSSVRELPAIVRAAGMPGGIGHVWVKDRFVKPNPKGGTLLIGKGGNKRIFIHATLDDNPEGDPNYGKSLDALPEAERKAKRFGDWDSYLGTVFEEFRSAKFDDEPANALHVIEPFDIQDKYTFGIPKWWPKIVAIDWGFAPPAATYISYGAISPEKKLYIFREDWFQREKIEEWAAKIKPIIDIINPQTIALCQSAAQKRGQEHSIHQQIEQALDQTITLSGNSKGSRVAGKMLIHEYLRWKPKARGADSAQTFNQEFADWLLRNKGKDDYNNYLDSFNTSPVEDDSIPRLQIFKNCPLLIEAIRACSYDKTDSQDVEEFAGDDPYDTLRYLVNVADHYFDEASEEMNRMNARLAVERQYQLSQDMTAFYRNARKLDNMERNEYRPVSRYHRRPRNRSFFDSVN